MPWVSNGRKIAYGLLGSATRWMSIIRYSRQRIWTLSRIGPVLPTCEDLGVPPVTGRLGQSVEGGGKGRCHW